MSLIIATGSNIGDSVELLNEAKRELSKIFELIQESRIYTSKAVDYLDQPDFFNQVLEFKIPGDSPQEVMNILLALEKRMGRTRDVLRGPRTIDLDILFWGMTSLNTDTLTIPHPRWSQRSFVVLPLKELPFFQNIEKRFIIPESFEETAAPLATFG